MHSDLAALLRQRLDIIADRAFYERDPAGHLETLKTVSEKIAAYTQAHLSSFDPKLRHFLNNASYQKALDHLTTERGL